MAAQFLSAGLSPMNSLLAVKYALRMAAAAVFALAVAATPREVVRRALPALTVSGGVVATLAILEGLGVTALDRFLDDFRVGPFWVGVSRRASAGSESPNLAAAMLLYGLVPGVGLASLRPRAGRVIVPLTALFVTGLTFTYSRGGLLALALATLCGALAAKRSPFLKGPVTALGAFLGIAAVLAVTARTLERVPSPVPGPPARAARYEPGETFLAFAPGETRRVPVTLTNTGRSPWTTGALGCTWQRAEAERTIDWAATAHCPITPVPPVAPGDSVTLQAETRAPGAEGRYLLVWDLVADGWVMSSAGIPPATIPTVVARDHALAQPFVLTMPAGLWRGGRPALWRAALAMWRERPVTGVGPDNFRWALAEYVGGSRGVTQDTLISASNMFLEAAATTGTLGLLALLGTLVATARACLRSLSRAPRGSSDAVWPAVWLALVVGIVVHGTVDSLLGFTGHYLFLGIVVGAASQEDALIDAA